MIDFKAISRTAGMALLVNALFMFLAMIVSVINDFDEGMVPLSISFLITVVTGSFPLIFVRKTTDADIRSAYVMIIISWLLSFCFGMLPYILYGGEFTVMNAWFESVSGYTTTGSTILTDIESLPPSILFWRSSTHFIGGLGVVVFLLLIIPDSTSLKLKLSHLEVSSMSRNAFQYKAGTTLKVMLSVYVGLTIAETLALWAAGMTFLDAVNHSFSTIATGGFSTKNNSIMYYDSTLIDIIVMVFMVLSSIHFGSVFAIFAKRSLKPLKSSVIKYYLSVIIVLSLSVTLVLLVQGGYDSLGNAFMDSAFQVVSYISTTGFGQADNTQWPAIANVLLLFAAFHCGCAGSTTGGVKADRMLLAFREMRSEFLRRLHPSSMFLTRQDGQIVGNEKISSVFMYIVAYFLILMLSFIAVLTCGVEVGDAFSGTLSSLGNVGPGTGALGTMGNFASMPSSAKIIFTFDMFVGRVEIFPLLVVLSMCFNGRR